MDEKAIIECIKDFFKSCPYLDELTKIKVDYLDNESKDYNYWSLESIGTPRILKKNVIGTKTERQINFVLATRSFFNPSVDVQNIKNLHIFDKIADWLYESTKNKNLPILNDGESAISIEALDSPYLFGTDKTNTLARYQMPCKMIYEKREERNL